MPKFFAPFSKSHHYSFLPLDPSSHCISGLNVPKHTHQGPPPHCPTSALGPSRKLFPAPSSSATSPNVSQLSPRPQPHPQAPPWTESVLSHRPPPQRPPSNLFLLLTGSQTVDLWFDIESGEVDFLLGTSVGPRCQAAWQAKGQAPAGMSTLPATPHSQNLHATPSALPLGDSAWPSPPPPEALVS